MNNRPTFKLSHEAHNVQLQTEPTRVSRLSSHYKMSQNLLLVSSDSLAKKRRKNTLRSHAVQTGRLAPAACYDRSPWNYTMPHLLHFTVFTAVSPGVEPLLLEFTTSCRPRTELLFVRPGTTLWQVGLSVITSCQIIHILPKLKNVYVHGMPVQAVYCSCALICLAFSMT
jgi:hypothetical protein